MIEFQLRKTPNRNLDLIYFNRDDENNKYVNVLVCNKHLQNVSNLHYGCICGNKPFVKPDFVQTNMKRRDTVIQKTKTSICLHTRIT